MEFKKWCALHHNGGSPGGAGGSSPFSLTSICAFLNTHVLHRQETLSAFPPTHWACRRRTPCPTCSWNMLLNPRGIKNAPGPACPRIADPHPGGVRDQKFEMAGFPVPELTKFLAENNIVGRGNAVKNRNLRLRACEAPLPGRIGERRHARTRPQCRSGAFPNYRPVFI